MNSPVINWVKEKTGLYEKLNPDTLQKWREEKLFTAYEYARKNSGFYSRLPDSISALTDLPFTWPEDIAADPLAFLAIPRNRVARVTTLANSGTTPKRKRIFFSENDLERTKDFFTAGMSTLVSRGDRAQILISNKTENSLGSLLSESLARIGVASEISPALKSVEAAIQASTQADCLIGMPAELLYLCRTAPWLRPKCVLLAADLAPQSVINGIREAWNCDVYFHYGHTEFGFGCAVDCPYHEGLHLRDADLIFEITGINSDKPVDPGNYGEIVITTLSNEAMPLIRYRTGNRGRIINTPCGCGVTIPRLEMPEGRISNDICLPGQKVLNIFRLDEILFADPGIRGFNAELLKEDNAYTLRLTVDSQCDTDVDSLIEKLSLDINITLNYGKADPFTHRGKRHINVSEN